jgi:transcriptional regulator with XRE-family HTH domain
MLSMNKSIRTDVGNAMTKQNINQSQLAQRIGVTRQYLNNYLNGKAGDVPRLWQKIFDELDLELVTKGKEKVPRAKT